MAKIAVLAGDGIGPEIVAEAVKVLRVVGETFGIALEMTPALVGGAAYDATGHPLPPDTLALAKESDAILLGAVGGPKYDMIEPPDLRPERGALLPLRKHLGLYANLRPAILAPALASASSLKPSLVEGGLDLLVVRELTGGLYFGQPKSNDGERAIDTCVYTRAEIVRIAHVGFQAAQGRSKKLASVDKANVLETSRLWRTVVHEIAAEYPEVELTDILVDNCAMQLVRDPRQFDVIVTENLFGDISFRSGRDAHGQSGNASVRLARHGGQFRWRRFRPLRTLPWFRAGHRGQGRRQSAGDDSFRRDAPALLAQK